MSATVKVFVTAFVMNLSNGGVVSTPVVQYNSSSGSLLTSLPICVPFSICRFALVTFTFPEMAFPGVAFLEVTTFPFPVMLPLSNSIAEPPSA